MALVHYACMTAGCRLQGTTFMYDSDSLPNPLVCAVCERPLVLQEDLAPADVPDEAVGGGESPAGATGAVAQATGPPYGGHSLIMGDYDAIPPPRVRPRPVRRGETSPPPSPPPTVPRKYGGTAVTGEPFNDNGHIAHLVDDLQRLGYWGPRSRREARTHLNYSHFVLNGGTALRDTSSSRKPEVFDFYIVGSVLALKADLRFRYNLTDTPYRTPTRPANLEKLGASLMFCQGIHSTLARSWTTLLPLNQPARGNERQARVNRQRQLGQALSVLQARPGRRGRPSLPDQFREISSGEVGAAAPVYTSSLQATAQAAADLFIDALTQAAVQRRKESSALAINLDAVLTEASTTTAQGEARPWANAEAIRTLVQDLDTAVEAWRSWLVRQLATARPYLTELILLGSVDNGPINASGPTTTAMRIQQMLAGVVPGITDPIFRVPRNEELTLIPETGQRDVIVSTRAGSAITPVPAALPVVEGIAAEAGPANRAPASIIVSYVSHESGGRHTQSGTGFVTYGVDWDCDNDSHIVKLHRHDFDLFRCRPAGHWAWSRGWGMGQLTPTRRGNSGGVARSVRDASGREHSIPFVRGLPTQTPIPEIICNARENLAQSIRLLRYNFNHTERSSPRQCTYLNAETQAPTFNCAACLRRFQLNRDLLLQEDIYLSEDAYRALPEYQQLRTRLGHDPTADELRSARQEYPCSWLRALTMMAGGRPDSPQTAANFATHYSFITGRMQMPEPAGEEEEGEQEEESDETPPA